MLITHHPLIFTGLKNVTETDFVGRRVLKLAEDGISYFALHTNYDTDLMGDLAAERLMLRNCRALIRQQSFSEEDEDVFGMGRIGMLPDAVSLRQLAEKVDASFNTRGTHVFGEEETAVQYVAILPGSGKSGIQEAIECGADVLVTGDIDHHAGLDAQAQGLAVIDAGHYGLEHIFIEDVAERLKEQFPEIRVVKDQPRVPYFTI